MEVLRKTQIKATTPEEGLIENLRNQLKENLVNPTCFGQAAAATILIVRFAGDDIILLKYIRGRKGDIQKACDSIIRYAQVSSEIYPDLFPADIPEQVRLVFELKVISVLRHTDREGRIIVQFASAGWDPRSILLNDIIAAARVLADGLLEFPSSFEKGIILILNAQDVGIRHIKQFTIPVIIKFVNVLMRSYPIRIGRVHIVNCPKLVSPVYTLLKPFLPNKLTSRVQLSSGLSELVKGFPTEILPESLGGPLPDNDAMLSFVVILS